MDLSYGPEYETFRQEVRAFLDAHGDQAPRGQGLRAEQTLIWQQLLIKHGYTARTIPTAFRRWRMRDWWRRPPVVHHRTHCFDTDRKTCTNCHGPTRQKTS